VTSDQTQTTDWPALWAALAGMEGDAWDNEQDRLDALWKGEYKQAFVAHALTRPGWDRENAEAWADDIVAEAWAACGNECPPHEVAVVDVEVCEEESRYV
jgi:hypothetical protein